MPSGEPLVAQRFVTHGSFVAMPLCFPSVTVPIDPDESFVTALAIHSDGMRVIGGTSGSRAHLFEADLKPVGGYVCDLGAVEGASEAVRVLVLRDRAIGCFNTEAGGKVVLQWILHRVNGIQEWSRPRPEMETLVELGGERLSDAWIEPDGRWLLLLTDRRVLRVDLGGCPTQRTWREKPDTIEPRDADAIEGGEVGGPCVSGFAVSAAGEVFACLRGGSLSRIDSGGGRAEETEVSLPFSGRAWGWAASPDGRLLAADTEPGGPQGRLFAVDVAGNRVEELGHTVAAPVRCMACLPDGRAYGFSGDGIGRFFLLDVPRKTVTDLGAVAAVMGVKRYGNSFSCAVAGPDGEIYLGEDDRGGHLWVYFPPSVGRPVT